MITGIQWYIQPHDITLWLPRGMSWPCRMPNGCWWVYLSNQRNHGFRLMRLGPSKKSMAELVGFLDGLADPKNHGISSHWWGLEMFGDPCERHIQSPCRVQWFLGWMENKRIKSEFRISPRWIKFVVRNFRSYTTVKDLIFVFWECCLFLNRITVWFWAFSCNNGEFLRFHCCSCFSPLPFNDWVVIYVYPIIQEVFWCIKKKVVLWICDYQQYFIHPGFLMHLFPLFVASIPYTPKPQSWNVQHNFQDHSAGPPWLHPKNEGLHHLEKLMSWPVNLNPPPNYPA